MDYTSILIGLLSSIVASFLVLFLMFTMRPKLAVSAVIARTAYEGRKAFVIKIVNKTWWGLYDIHAELAHIKFENATGGHVYSKSLELLKNHIWSINSLYSWKADVNAEYAVLFVCLDDLDVLWTKESIVEFRVMAKHSFSGFSRIRRKRFYRAQAAIRSGAFKFGNSLEID